jgi:D-threo-aldose 1-dehydrogenase
MKKRPLGCTDLSVTELGFGGASIGNLYEACTEPEAQTVIEKSWDLGVRFFDTAPEYGHGLSERRMGDYLRRYDHNDYVISTKVGDFLYARANELPPPSKFINQLPFFLKYDYSYDGIMRAFEDSLQRLGLNRVDILLVHDLDPVIHDQKTFADYFKIYIESGYKALDELRSQGIVKAMGLGVKKSSVCEEALKYGQYECFMLQGNYTLLEQPALASFLPLCEQQKISILLAGPFASGILATGPVSGAYFHHQPAEKNILDRVKKIQVICARYQVPMQAVAIQFPLFHPAIASVVIGTRSAQRMVENVQYLNHKIPASLWEELKHENIIPPQAPTT